MARSPFGAALLVAGTVLSSVAIAEYGPLAATLGMVVSVSQAASEAGCDVLRQGGNAVDAAVATAFALAVTYPEAGNIGGGGFMLVYPGPGKPVTCIDYRETAPQAATPQRFAADDSRIGLRAVGVPGTVRGLALAHQRHRRLKWNESLAPAIRLAADGFVVDRAVARSLNAVLGEPGEFAELRRVYGRPDGQPWQAGDRLGQPDLAATLDAWPKPATTISIAAGLQRKSLTKCNAAADG